MIDAAERINARKAEQTSALDHLLCLWHQWQQAGRVSNGYAARSAGFEAYRCSRQYDDANGALDTDLDAMRSAQVDFEVSQMNDPHRTAIYFNARNLCTGRTVWLSPRLPVERVALAEVVNDARVLITARLQGAGLI